MSAFYTYDGFNQLIRVENESGLTRYGYGADGLRSDKEVNGAKQRQVWQGGQLVYEYRHGTNAVVSKYIRGINLIAGEIAGSARQFYLYNAHGDVAGLTNAAGSLTRSYDYDAFGVERGLSSADTNPFRYCGEYYDKETGKIYLRARYYTPKLGRFSTVDPIRDGTNWYLYCYNNPLRYIDPSGLPIPSPKEMSTVIIIIE